MELVFQSLRSGSSGNCLMLRADDSAILLDCGIRTQYACRDLLTEHLNGSGRLQAVVVSHAHGDHISYAALRVLTRQGIPVHCHQDILAQVHHKHVAGRGARPSFRPFSHAPFTIGAFELQPIELPHDPSYLTFGFVIRAGGRKIVIATDFHQPEAIAPHLVDADFVFLESNHDPELLRLFWNPSSLYHLSNPRAAGLLCDARRARSTPPQMVMLGHLSRQRNSDELALQAVRQRFEQEQVELDFRLTVAPRGEASEAIRIA